MEAFHRKILGVLSLPIPHWRAIFRARRLLIEIDRSLRDDGLAKTRQNLLDSNDSRTALFAGQKPKDIVRAIRRASRLSIGHRDSCLRRSLLLWWILKTQDIETVLKTGVTSWDGKMTGHAWVELMGKPINDGTNVRDIYTVIETETF